MQNVEEALHDLKIRFELLEGDRKAYFETSQWTMKQNKDALFTLRQENKSFRDLLSKLKKLEVDQSATYSLPEFEKQNQQLCASHRKYDELIAETKKRQVRLSNLCDQMEELQREEQLVKTNQNESTQAKEIRLLEIRLDKATIKYNEAQSIRKTYEQIVKLLKEEKLSFDAQLSTLNKVLKAKKEDVSSLDKMFRDASHAKELAKSELLRFEQKIIEDRKHREKELLIRRDQIREKVDFTDKFDRKMLQLENTRNDARFHQDKEKVTIDSGKEKVAREYEEKVKEITNAVGVSNIKEIIHKIDDQEAKKVDLNALQAINEQRLLDMKTKLKKIHEMYEEITFSTGSSNNLNNAVLEKDLAVHLETAQAKMAENMQKYENSSKLLAQVEHGIKHFAKKVNATVVNENSDVSAIALLEQSHKKITVFAANIKGKEIPESYITSQQLAEPVAILQVNPLFVPENNIRVALRPVAFENVDGENEEEEDSNEEIPSRAYIKKQAQARLDSQNKGKAKKSKKKRAKEEGSDSD